MTKSDGLSEEEIGKLAEEYHRRMKEARYWSATRVNRSADRLCRLVKMGAPKILLARELALLLERIGMFQEFLFTDYDPNNPPPVLGNALPGEDEKEIRGDEQ